MDGRTQALGNGGRLIASDDASIDVVKELDRTMSEMRKISDLEGLLRLQAQALAISHQANGRTRRKAQRIADKASGAVHQLRELGTETALERADRIRREEVESQLRSQAATARLLDRMVTLLHLLLFEGRTAEADVGSLEVLADTDSDGFLQIEIPDLLRARSDALVAAFERSHEVFADSASRKKIPGLERALKTMAVELVSHGAEVRNLTKDAVPLVAYGMFVGRLSLDVESPDVVSEKLDDIMLGFAGETAQVPALARATFISLLRLALLLGQAQAFAERDSVSALTVAPA